MIIYFKFKIKFKHKILNVQYQDKQVTREEIITELKIKILKKESLF